MSCPYLVSYLPGQQTHGVGLGLGVHALRMSRPLSHRTYSIPLVASYHFEIDSLYLQILRPIVVMRSSKV